MVKKLNKILILYAAVGSGHEIAALAIEQAIKTSDKNIEIKRVDVMSYSKVRVASPVSKINYRSPAAGLIYDILWKNEKIGRLAQNTISIIKENFSPIARLLKEYNPSVIISTHGLCAIVISAIKQEGKLDIPHIAVLTDLRTHPCWPKYGVDLYCASTLAAKIDLLNSGVNYNLIKVSGIPLRKEFLKNFPPKRSKVNKTIKLLILAGAIQSSPYASLATKLSEIIQEANNAGASITVLCGKDKDLRNELTHYMKLINISSNVNTLGYIKNMAQLMSRHDLIITKPGGLICSEAIATRTPLILLTKNAYGQEKANALLLINNGVALELKQARNLSKLLKLVSSGNIISEMSRKMSKLATTNSSSFIANYVLRLIK